MKKTIFIFVIFVCSLFNDLLACRCETSSPFIDVFYGCSFVGLISPVKFYESYGFTVAMDVEIIRTIKGDASLQRIKIWGDERKMCRMSISYFAEDSLWIIALYNSSSDYGHPGEKEGDYFISICGSYYLNVESDSVIGYIQEPGEIQRMQID